MPKVVAMVITSLQLLQMVVGCAVNYFAFKFKESGEFLLVYKKMHLSQDLLSVCPKFPFPDRHSIPLLRHIHSNVQVVCAGRPCAVSDNNLFYSALMYFSYFLLFARLIAEDI